LLITAWLSQTAFMEPSKEWNSERKLAMIDSSVMLCSSPWPEDMFGMYPSTWPWPEIVKSGSLRSMLFPVDRIHAWVTLACLKESSLAAKSIFDLFLDCWMSQKPLSSGKGNNPKYLVGIWGAQ
jgi:hypothetical protein